jgi:threonine/homoserine/homoserine lactone efflux protein
LQTARRSPKTLLMDPTAALIAGLVAGFAIAMQVGAVSLLLIEASIASGPRAGVAAGMGVATADFAYAVVAAAAGGVVGAALASHESEIKIVAALTLAAIAIHGLAKLRAERRGGELAAARDAVAGDAAAGDAAADGAAAGGAAACDAAARDAAAGGPPRAHYARFLAITAANPLTIASFAAVAAALSLDGAGAAAAFAVGVGLASAGWHLVLTLAAGHAGRWVTPRIRRGLAIGGRLAVLAIAAHLAL